MKNNLLSFFTPFLPHIAAVALFAALTLAYFQPLLDGKAIVQGDMNQVQGMAQELVDFSKTDKDTPMAWTGSMFSGMPSYQITTPNYPNNYIGIVYKALSLNDYLSSGIIFGGLVCAYLFFFLLTGNFWLSILGALAVAFSSYNLIIIQAGHVTKGWAIAFMPLVLSGFMLIARKKWIFGGALFAFGLAVELSASHIQISYYLALLCVFLYLAYLIYNIKNKAYNSLLKGSLILLVGLAFAVLPKLAGFYAELEMGRESLRGPSELSSPAQTADAPRSTGLDRDYAFAWSYGRGETLSLLVPNINGGESGGRLGKDSHLYKELKQKGQRLGKDIQTYTYWGDKPFTSGPVYAGACIFFLFVLGMFAIKNSLKWWLFGAALFFVFLSWGRNFAALNDFLFYNLPFYNKFRTPEMALVIPALILPIIGVWGLKSLISGDEETKRHKLDYLKFSTAITGGICLILWLIPGVFFSFESEYDQQFASQVPDWYYSALIADRQAMLSSDALRSLVFVLLTSVFVYFLIAKNSKLKNWSLAGIALLALIDLWAVDKRYLNDSNFDKKRPEQTFEKSYADKIILEDKSLSYRVLNLSGSTFNEAKTSYFHKSIGGYHAAKLRRYQELIDARIQKEIQLFAQNLSKIQSQSGLDSLFSLMPTINMLNGKYIILNPETAPIVNPKAFGNAWFVEKLTVVENADAELEALNFIDPQHEAVTDRKFENIVSQKTYTRDSTDNIALTLYHPVRLVYHSSTSSPQLAVFSEIYFADGWKAFIDGQPATYFRADWTLRAMNVPQGEHEIEFRFEPDNYARLASLGTWSSLLLLALVAGAIILTIVRSVKTEKQEK